jgi:hypothetical protein
MKENCRLILPLIVKRITALIMVFGLIIFSSVEMELPISEQIVFQIKIGRSIGNTLNVIYEETVWGGAIPTITLIDSVNANGSSSVRQACTGLSLSGTNTGIIADARLVRVKEATDYCINLNVPSISMTNARKTVSINLIGRRTIA